MVALPARALGDGGPEVSVVGLGANNFGRRIDRDATRAVVDAALAEGITFIDTADIYGRGASEELLGQVLAGRRAQVVLATKFGMSTRNAQRPLGSAAYIRQAVRGSLRRLRTEPPRGSAAYIRQAVRRSLRCLRTDFIDVYWYHQPDGVTPIADTLGELHNLVRAGTVRAIGASNFSAEQIEEADAVARERGLTRFTAIQNEYSLLDRDAERDILPTCARLGLGFVPYFPLASGLLSGKYRPGEPGPAGARLSNREQIASDEQFALIAALERYAGERGVSLLEVAIGALLARPEVSSVIAGATKPEQVRANAAAAAWVPSDADLAALEGVLAAAERPAD